MKREYFNRIAPEWDKLPAPPDAGGKVSRFVRQAVDPGARRILDVGCGTGVLAASVLGACPQLSLLVEMDFAFEMLRENRQKHREEALERVCADGQLPPFTEAAFDAVLCFGILPHLPDWRAALSSLLRLLRPAGTLSIGHLMSSAELNAFHSSLSGPVANDRLVPAGALREALLELGAAAVLAEEEPGWYFVRCARSAP